MHDLIKLLHQSAAIVWLGGMTFMLLALRPAALVTLEPQPRARLMVAMMQRFLPLVAGLVLLLFATGTSLYTTGFRAVNAATGSGPLGWLAIGALRLLH